MSSTTKPSGEHLPSLYGAQAERERLRYVIDERDWKPMKIGGTVLPDFHWIPVAQDENGAWQSYWMRMRPGARSPEHVHESTELLFVEHGVFADGDGVDYLPGDMVVYRAGSRHTSYSKEGCVVLVVARAASTIA
ncbi:cupin domain-containing protein [Burkholderia ambifaria]|uniref:cupin domain-containing protein n=1 Tax=Burkholderia ambifaria TaxID=152480 RepID=UPI001BA0A12A|nr:cupin domain-containing protein [Burkholderia ambifaria]MBR8184211.1 cupin domain-containing protein [Burkholderia ambifaria]